jgi:hypothetical protein
MFKTVLALALLLVSLNGFSIYETVKGYQQVQDINWPFTVCGKGTWTAEKLTLGSTPARNTNDDITVVLPSLDRPAPPTTTSASRKSPWRSSLMGSSCTQRPSPSPVLSEPATPCSSSTPTTSPGSLPPGPTA